jgi:hypothetical protein
MKHIFVWRLEDIFTVGFLALLLLFVLFVTALWAWEKVKRRFRRAEPERKTRGK